MTITDMTLAVMVTSRSKFMSPMITRTVTTINSGGIKITHISLLSVCCNLIFNADNFVILTIVIASNIKAQTVPILAIYLGDDTVNVIPAEFKRG
jgi:hypothetical protein